MRYTCPLAHSLTLDSMAMVQQAQALYTSLKEAEKDFDQVRKLERAIVSCAFLLTQ